MLTLQYILHLARLVAVPGGSIGENLCVTSLPSPTATDYVYLRLASCGSDITPPGPQDFILETNDFGHEITFVSTYFLSLTRFSNELVMMMMTD